MRHDTEKLNFIGKKIIAHRGTSGLETENSLAAFIAAGNRSYYGIECDIHRTADGRYVVIHDSETGRVSDTKINVETCDFGRVREVLLNDTGDSNGAPRKDLFIPEYAEYLKICAKYEKIAVVEFKGVFEKAWIEEVIEITRTTGCLEHTVFIAFDAENLLALRQILPAQPAQLLACEWREDFPEFLSSHGLDLDIGYTSLTRERIAACRKQGVKVNCWTVDDKSSAEKLLDAGVDFITSNILE